MEHCSIVLTKAVIRLILFLHISEISICWENPSWDIFRNDKLSILGHWSDSLWRFYGSSVTSQNWHKCRVVADIFLISHSMKTSLTLYSFLNF